MSKKKGLSLEEKRTKMLEIFTDSQDVYQLKDIEKIAPKMKGIISQSVKDVLMSLVDDNLVDSEKIGTSTYFWAFPSKVVNAKRNLLKDLEKKKEDMTLKNKETAKRIKELKETLRSEDPADEVTRVDLQKKMDFLKKRADLLKQELAKYKDLDPDQLERMKSEMEIAKEATERWTDNVFQIRTWIKNKTGMEESTINKQFGIPDDFDYLD